MPARSAGGPPEPSGINPVERARKGDRFPEVIQLANPGDDPLDAHAEPGMRHCAVLAQIEVPLKGLCRKLVCLKSLQKQLVVVNALAAAYDLTITLGSQNVHAEGQVRALGIRLHVKRLHLRGIAMNHDGAIKFLGQDGFVAAAKISSPLDLRT